uniref:Cyclin A1 n=1 Tax=Silene latifolia TaxID=37657 RepID=Q84LE4_SILLA|nr:cyclin A1 [Silene latifolia]
MSTQAHRNRLLGTENGNGGGGVKVVNNPKLTKKRPPLSNLTNHPRPSLVPSAITKSTKAKRDSSTGVRSTSFPAENPSATLNSKPSAVVPLKTAFTRSNVLVSCKASLPNGKGEQSHITRHPASCTMDTTPTPEDAQSVSMDESMSTCDSLKSPEVEYMDENDVAALCSIERKTSKNLYISDDMETTGSFCKREIVSAMEIDKVVDVDDNHMDPQFCSTIACDIYKHLRESETQKRPSTDFMEQTQKDINASMRAILVDWLVEVAEEYRLVPDTLYLTVNYIDRYLSGNAMNRQRLQLLGVACMMIAAKYEEICAPQVEEFCYITDNTYFKEEVLQMESGVLNFLKFEMTAPTTKNFLRRFVRAAQVMNEVPAFQLECLANYVAELSLLEYSMLKYAPSLIAASSVFLAKYMLTSSRPWNATLRHYTLYEASDLEECVKALHQLCLNSHISSLPAIREKYSHHKYKSVAKKHCPSSIPAEYFQNSSC